VSVDVLVSRSSIRGGVHPYGAKPRSWSPGGNSGLTAANVRCGWLAVDAVESSRVLRQIFPSLANFSTSPKRIGTLRREQRCQRSYRGRDCYRLTREKGLALPPPRGVRGRGPETTLSNRAASDFQVVHWPCSEGGYTSKRRTKCLASFSASHKKGADNERR
jgi:hypothetical protein